MRMSQCLSAKKTKERTHPKSTPEKSLYFPLTMSYSYPFSPPSASRHVCGIISAAYLYIYIFFFFTAHVLCTVCTHVSFLRQKFFWLFFFFQVRVCVYREDESSGW